MSKHIERYSTFEASIVGHQANPKEPLELLVVKVVSRGHLFAAVSEPFSAFTSRPVEKICGGAGILLKGGIMIPWVRLDRHDDLVLIRQDLRRPTSLPMVLIKSLVNGGLRT